MALVHTHAMLKRTTIWLTREQVKRLQAVAKRKGLKAAQLIRLYVDAGLSKEKMQKKSGPARLLKPSGSPNSHRRVRLPCKLNQFYRITRPSIPSSQSRSSSNWNLASRRGTSRGRRKSPRISSADADIAGSTCFCFPLLGTALRTG